MELSLEAQQLLMKKKQAEKASDYLLADQLNKRYKQLIKSQYKSKLQQAINTHRLMLQQMDSLQAQKIQQYRQDHHRMLDKYREDRFRRQEEILKRQEEEINQLFQDASVTIRPYRKEQSEILELRKQEKEMVRLENYIEAHNIKVRVMEMEEEREEAHRVLRERKIMVLIEQLKGKHRNELGVERQKTDQGVKEREKAGEQHLAHLHQKYLNVRQEIISEQTVIITKLEKNKPKEDGKFSKTSNTKLNTSKLLASSSPRSFKR